MIEKLVTCINCGKVHFEVSYKYAIEEVNRFNNWYKTQPKKIQDNYGGKAKIQNYLNCHCGNSYEKFRDAKSKDSRMGETIGPILSRKDEGKLVKKLYG